MAALGAMPAAAYDKGTLVWLLRDLPPLTILEGTQKNQGAVDQFMPLLIASMPEYQHSLMRVNRARAMQMLLEPSFTCDPSLLWNPQRAKRLVYSIPAFRILSNGITIRHKDRGALAPYIIDNQVDLGLLLARDNSKRPPAACRPTTATTPWAASCRCSVRGAWWRCWATGRKFAIRRSNRA